jgi:hypothetical protein
MKKNTTISNNTFVGVQWDAKAVEAVNLVALALLNLTELFKTQGINIEALLKIDKDEVNTGSRF